MIYSAYPFFFLFQIASQLLHLNIHDFTLLNISIFKIPSSILIFSITYRFGRQFMNRNIGRSIQNDDITTK